MSTLEFKKQNIIKELKHIDEETDIPEWYKKILDECLVDSETETELVSVSFVKEKYYAK